MLQNKMWVSRYAPKSIEESILPESIKTVFQGYRDNNTIPNLLLSGSKGIGKTSLVLALTTELGCRVKFINASNEGRLIDTLRVDVEEFCTSTSLVSRNARKVVIYDEVDNSTNDVQQALKAMIEKYQDHVSFIFTCNLKNKVIEPIQSRCYNVDFTIKKDEIPQLLCDFTDRMEFILKENNVNYDEDVLIALVKKRFPDFRNIIHELQTYAMAGDINEGILADNNISIRGFFDAIKKMNINKMREWILQNLHHDRGILLTNIYEYGYNIINVDSIADFIYIINESQNHSPMNSEIELMDVAIKIASTCKFK